MMRYRDGRRSLCLSSQSGCPLTCGFCATGRMRFAGNLSADEILDQALHFRRRAARPCRLHGDGRADDEPRRRARGRASGCPSWASRTAARRSRRSAGSRASSGSTASGLPVRLALSLHAAEDALRSELMPVNLRYPLARVLDACRADHARRRRAVFVEYVMLAGVNDRYEQALALAGAARRARRSRST